ncbi:MAG: TetR/AcrR family transcriptional regulator [Eubacteriaceae bacterium]|nr:TetR/AcrR family transcriptional regulator [Eubacteriaceae bacterium]
MKQDLRIIKGLETKKRIMDCAKYTFQRYGYKDATIVEITHSAGVPIGLFTYYFKTKSNIVNHVHNDYLEKLRSTIMSYDWIRDETPLLTHSIENYIYYDNILSDEMSSRFFLEVLSADLQAGFLDETARATYEEYISFYDIFIDSSELDILVTFNSGGKKKLIMKYLEKQLQIDQSQLVNFIVFNDIDSIAIPDGEKQRVKDKIIKRLPEIDAAGINMLSQ